LTSPSSFLVSIPPLAVPVKLYGVQLRKNCNTDKFLSTLVKDLHSSPCQFEVSVLERDPGQLPLVAQLRYSVERENDGNLALDLVKLNLCNIITSSEQWIEELYNHGLSWMPDITVPKSLSCHPHPIPLAVDSWFAAVVHGIPYVLVDGVETDPTIDDDVANRIGVHFYPLSSLKLKDKKGVCIDQNLAVYANEVKAMEESLSRKIESLSNAAKDAQVADSPQKGQDVLIQYKYTDGSKEWCRGVVEVVLAQDIYSVMLTDYGHRVFVTKQDIFQLNRSEKLMPVHVQYVRFAMPCSNEELFSVRSAFDDDYVLMRVENVCESSISSEVEEIYVSIWKVSDEPEAGAVLTQIC